VKKPVKLGLIGVGAWGKNYLRTVAKMDGVSVPVVLRSSFTPINEFPDVYIARDLDDLFSLCDGVVIATPPSSHEYLTIRSLEAGKPVLVEKPVSLDFASTRRMFDCSDRCGISLLVGHIHLFSSAFRVLREWTSEWSPKSINSLAGGFGPFRSYSPLLDWGPHDISMCLSLFNRAPDEVKVDKIESESGFMYELFLSFSPSFANLKFGNGLKDKCRIFSVFHEEDEAIYDGNFRFKGRTVPTSSISPLEELLTVFSNYITTGKTDWRFDPFLSLETARILDAASFITATH
jgi:predicted dehydrogenase